MTTAMDDFIARARAVPVIEYARAVSTGPVRGGDRGGPCPVCGGKDRFAVNERLGVWNCRGSQRAGDTIALAAYVLGLPAALSSRSDLILACEEVLGETAPRDDDTEEARAARAAARAAREAEAAERRERQAAEAADASAVYRERERAKAFGLWRVNGPWRGTLTEAYLRHRGLDRLCEAARDGRVRLLMRHGDRVPFWHATGQKDARGRDEVLLLHEGPAMLWPIVDAAGVFMGLHITWIDPTFASPKGRPVVLAPDGEALPTKKVRGSQRGGQIIVVDQPSPTTAYRAEGVETVAAVWCAIDAGRPSGLAGATFRASVNWGNLGGKAVGRVRHPTETQTDKAGRVRARQVPGPVPDLTEPAMSVPDSVTRDVLLADGDCDRTQMEMVLARAAARSRLAAEAAGVTREVVAAWPGAGADFCDLLRGRG